MDAECIQAKLPPTPDVLILSAGWWYRDRRLQQVRLSYDLCTTECATIKSVYSQYQPHVRPRPFQSFNTCSGGAAPWFTAQESRTISARSCSRVIYESSVYRTSWKYYRPYRLVRQLHSMFGSNYYNIFISTAVAPNSGFHTKSQNGPAFTKLT